MKRNIRHFKWFTILLALSLYWGCEHETSPPPIDFEADNEVANYIIAQLNQVPDNSFSEMQQYYGEPLWNEAYIEGYEEKTTFVIPFMQYNTVQTIVCYKQPTSYDKTLQPTVINHDYLESALFVNKFFSSLKFHQLKQKGYCIDDCLAEYAVSWLTAKTKKTIERSMIEKPEVSLKADEDGAGFWVKYALPHGQNGTLATDLSRSTLTSKLQNILFFIDDSEETEMYNAASSYAEADMSYIVLNCNTLADESESNQWLYIDYAIQTAMHYFTLEMADNYYSVTGMVMPEFSFLWYSNTSDGCFRTVASNDLDYLEEYAGAGPSNPVSTPSLSAIQKLNKIADFSNVPIELKVAMEQSIEDMDNNCVGQYILDELVSKNASIEFVYDPSLGYPGAYNASTDQFIVPSISSWYGTQLLIHEFTHALQDATYSSSVMENASTGLKIGMIQLELEAHVIEDLSRSGKGMEKYKRLSWDVNIQDNYEHQILKKLKAGDSINMDHFNALLGPFGEYYNPEYNTPPSTTFNPTLFKDAFSNCNN